MARTKAKARRGPDGHAFRENAKKKAVESQATATSTSGSGTGPRSAVSGSGNGKRKRNRERDGANNGEKGNEAKRRKGFYEDVGAEVGDGEGEKDGDGEGEGEGTTTAKGENPTKARETNDEAATSLLVPIFPGLEATHTVTTMSIISSSNINKKVSRILELLGTWSVRGGVSSEGGGEKDGKKHDVVMLYAKAPVVSKVVSVAEIAKREIAREGGKWFSYCAVKEVLGERKEREKEGRKEGGAKGNEDGEDGGESEEEAFEVMKTPFERALEVEGKPKVRAMPVMSLYLSRVRIEGLRKVYGEQTNAQEVK